MKVVIESEALKVKPSKNHLAKHTKSDLILKELSLDLSVRFYVAQNVNCSVEILEKLSNDSDFYVRSYVVENPNCPADILGKLSNDSSEYVRYYANKAINRIRSA